MKREAQLSPARGKRIGMRLMQRHRRESSRRLHARSPISQSDQRPNVKSLPCYYLGYLPFFAGHRIRHGHHSGTSMAATCGVHPLRHDSFTSARCQRLFMGERSCCVDAIVGKTNPFNRFRRGPASPSLVTLE